jgi:Domain of unknown function (DUF4390)
MAIYSPKRKLSALVIASLAVLIVLTATPVAAEKTPVIENIHLIEGESNVLLSATLSAELDEFMKEALKGGVPLTFSFKISLTRKGTIFKEKKVRSEKLTHTLQYNPVKQIYQFTGEGYGEPLEKTTKEEAEALDWMKGIYRWPLYPLRELRKDKKYRVRVMATLRSAELPSVFGYLFFFTSIFNRETPWSQVDFTY